MVLADVERSADPPAVRRTLDRLRDVDPAARARVDADPRLSATFAAVTAASPWLARLCTTDPAALDVLAGLDEPGPSGPGGAGSPGDLVRRKQLGLLRIAARDLTGRTELVEVVTALSDLADGLLAAAADSVPGAGDLCAVAMGKLGGRELNYASDIDLVLVGPTRTTPAARRLLDIVRAVWRVDLNLRPEGRSGALVRSLASYQAYWDRWAEPWEFQALLKARPVTGPGDLRAAFAAETARRVWERPFGADELRGLRTMKRQAEAEVTRQGLAERELKRGRGGIRDIEFAVQLLQLVHGRADPDLRSPATLPALAALAAGGYVDNGDAEALAEAYRFFRTAEHRLQLAEDQPVHALPADPAGRARLARLLGYRDDPAATARARFEEDVRRHQATGRSIHERLFFRPLLEAFTEPRRAVLGPAATDTRLAAFGFRDAARTRQAVSELTRGFSRSSSLMRQMLPLIFEWLSQAPDPDLGLLGLRSLATGEHRRSQLTGVFRESAEAARQICLLLGTGPHFVRGFERNPDLMASLGAGPRPDPGPVRSRPPSRAASLLGIKERETLRIGADDVLGRADVEQTGQSLSDLAEEVLRRAVAVIDPQVPMAVIAMGRLGGGELSYASDLDVLFVFDGGEDDAHALPAGAPAVVGPVGTALPAGALPAPGAHPAASPATGIAGTASSGVARARAARSPAAEAEAAAAALRRLVAGDTPARRVYELDVSLRPEGRQGPLARSLDAYATYYGRWAKPWERQALLRGRFVAGDPGVGARFAAIARAFVWGRPFDEEAVREVRRIKARMEGERVPPHEDAEFHLKLGPGSLTDVEWTAQLLQLIHGVPAAGTNDALAALVAAGALDPGDADVLTSSYRFCERTRNRLFLVRGQSADALPTTGPLLRVVARSLGTTPTGLREEYRRRTRRARRVADRLFWGLG
jgi:glutamate-ammonia-ligase adenylyltransferase